MIRGFCHLANGQEAVSTGVEAALEKEDSIITSYRCHGFVYTRGEPVGTILAELMGMPPSLQLASSQPILLASHLACVMDTCARAHTHARTYAAI